MTSSREFVFAADDRDEETVTVPEWKKDGQPLQFTVRGLSVEERNAVITASRTPEGTMNLDVYYPAIVVQGTYELGTYDKTFAPDDLGLLIGRNALAVDRLATPIMRLSGISSGSAEVAVDEAGKGSTAMNAESTS